MPFYPNTPHKVLFHERMHAALLYCGFSSVGGTKNNQQMLIVFMSNKQRDTRINSKHQTC